ncbi:MAG: hypothetical protein H6838_08990 [Planctomycetes bacterium]|nr:hypothetical protein [Planctomycetota bacterium]
MRTANFVWWSLVLMAALPAQQLHVTNFSSTERFEGWIRRGIDWSPGAPRGSVQGNAFVVGRELGVGARVLDVHVSLQPCASLTLDFAQLDPNPPALPTGPFVVPQPTIGGVPFELRSTNADGAGLDVHWRTRLGDLVVDLWCVLYPGQTWASGELQVTAHGPARTAMVPPGMVLRGGFGFAACALGAPNGTEIIPQGTTIAAGQGYSTLPVLFTRFDGDLASAAVAGHLAIGAVGLRNVWPLGNPSWLSSRGSPRSWTAANYARTRANLRGWSADSLGVHANANTSGGEGDQVFVGAECGRGAPSAGAELPNLFVAYGYARRPGKWRESNGDGLSPSAHQGLAMFEAYPFVRGGTQELLGLAEIPDRSDTHDWWEWREHWFRNRLFVAYRLTGSLALQWQIDQLARQYLYEHTIDPGFSTTPYTGALRGYGWSCLMVWWLHHALEDRQLAAAVRDRWRTRWQTIVGPRYASFDYWDIRHDSRLGPGMQWLAYQQAAAVMFLDMAGQVCAEPGARAAALRGALAVVDRAFQWDGQRWKGYGWVQMTGNQPMQLPLGGTFGPGIESWMAGAAVVVKRHQPQHQVANAILTQFVAENNVNGQWIAPDVLPGNPQ